MHLSFSKPKFLDSHVKKIEEGWEETKDKASQRLQLLQRTKDAWIGYADGLETIAIEFEKAEEEMKKVKKRFALASAIEDLEKRQAIFNDCKNTIEGMYKALQDNYDCMTMTLPDDKKDIVKKELKAITEKLECIGRFGDKVKKIEDFVANLSDFDKSLKGMDKWMMGAEQALKEIQAGSDKMTPEDRVSLTMELQEDIAARVKIVQADIEREEKLMPQGDKVPQDAQDFKDELKRIETFVLDLQKKVVEECKKFSEDIKYWAEYKTGIKEFTPWLLNAEVKSQEGLTKPKTLEEATATFAAVQEFNVGCEKNFKLLNEANAAANKMTTHKDADSEVEQLNARYKKVKEVGDEWFKKVETLVKEWQLLDTTVSELNNWVADDRKEGEAQFSLEKMESTLGELKNIFKEKEKLVENL